MAASKDIFISYRRDTGAELAEIIKKDLGARGYSVFKDTHDLKAGHWQEDLSRQINGCKDFILLVTPGALDRCKTDPNDVVLFEIRLALAQKKNFILVVKRGKGQTPEEAFKELPSSISDLPKHNWIEYTNEDSDAKLKKIRSFLDSLPSVWELASNRYGKQLLAGTICGGLLLCGLMGWALFGRTGRIENKVGEIANDTSSILAETGIIRRGVDDLGKLGGIRKNPASLEDYVHNARINELSGNLKDALTSYKSAIKISNEYVDINLIYFDLLKTKNGLDGALLEFSETTSGAGDSAPVACVKALAEPIEKRRQNLKSIISKNADFSPAYYLLASTYSPKVILVVSPLAASQEKKSLEDFLRLSKMGLARKYYFNRDIFENAVEDSNQRILSLARDNFNPIIDCSASHGIDLRTREGIKRAFVSFNDKEYFELKLENEIGGASLGEVNFSFPLSMKECRKRKIPVFNSYPPIKIKVKTTASDLDPDLVSVENGLIPIYVKLVDNTDLEFGPNLNQKVSVESLMNTYNYKRDDPTYNLNKAFNDGKEEFPAHLAPFGSSEDPFESSNEKESKDGATKKDGEK